MDDEDRIDGTELPEPTEPGSDALLSEAVRKRIADEIRDE